jgi:hypothetical protein
MDWRVLTREPKWFRDRKTRKAIAWVLFFASLIGWPVSIWLTDEPPFILSLSWLALTITAWDTIMTSSVNDED